MSWADIVFLCILIVFNFVFFSTIFEFKIVIPELNFKRNFPNIGDVRIRKVFPLAPMWLLRERKSVWLKWVTVEEEYLLIDPFEHKCIWKALREVNEKS